ncbi:PA0069 family radical SAM protein [Aquisalimonas sp. 2447]|uniref:PA0069 family radical SAM protein n=1 Tax=Aquisalimonas sp. 2447 TaxID=2740807 RepID=UPI0014323DE5|nr:PA0069 family radical SAM protein [Aquisalimonas sp. 2447]QIT55373.1 PA0069 family radical SAM protein [Aquisalimonas sp. 2447]
MLKGRGTDQDIPGRFARQTRQACDDGWPELPDAETSAPQTQCAPETARSIITRNQSPDVPFTQSVNPYRGCEHGCIYCFARPSHAYLDLSPGIDFETRLSAKTNAAERLRAELAKPAYHCNPIVLGTNTDPYQPVERHWGVTRQVLEVLRECRHPVSIITKGAGILRDLDLLAEMAEYRLVSVIISLTSMNARLKRALEPRAASPAGRLRVIRELHERGIPVGTLIAPVIPALTDHELEDLLAAAAEAGASEAGYVLLRLPWEVRPLFRQWLQEHYPERAEHVMSLLRQARDGRENDPCFGSRMRGSGPWADLLEQRFRKALRRHGLDRRSHPQLDASLFRAPHPGGQQDLFDDAGP